MKKIETVKLILDILSDFTLEEAQDVLLECHHIVYKKQSKIFRGVRLGSLQSDTGGSPEGKIEMPVVRSGKVSNLALGFSIFSLLVVIFIEVVIM